jgi:hypothetical protein
MIYSSQISRIGVSIHRTGRLTSTFGAEGSLLGPQNMICLSLLAWLVY